MSVCEWVEKYSPTKAVGLRVIVCSQILVYKTQCGRKCYEILIGQKYCPYCGKPIQIKQENKTDEKA